MIALALATISLGTSQPYATACPFQTINADSQRTAADYDVVDRRLNERNSSAICNGQYRKMVR
jgi:hypothetical protein